MQRLSYDYTFPCFLNLSIMSLYGGIKFSIGDSEGSNGTVETEGDRKPALTLTAESKLDLESSN